MNIDEVLKIAREASHRLATEANWYRLRAAIEQHVAEAVKAETDRCMAACEFMRPSVARGHPVNEAVFAAASVAVDSCIEAIRARADHEEAK